MNSRGEKKKRTRNEATDKSGSVFVCSIRLELQMCFAKMNTSRSSLRSCWCLLSSITCSGPLVLLLFRKSIEPDASIVPVPIRDWWTRPTLRWLTRSNSEDDDPTVIFLERKIAIEKGGTPFGGIFTRRREKQPLRGGKHEPSGRLHDERRSPSHRKKKRNKTKRR